MDVSTLSFWLYHHEPWYLAMLIAGSIWLLLGAVLYHTSPEFYNHLHLLHQTVFIIMIGYYCGKKVRPFN